MESASTELHLRSAERPKNDLLEKAGSMEFRVLAGESKVLAVDAVP